MITILLASFDLFKSVGFSKKAPPSFELSKPTKKEKKIKLIVQIGTYDTAEYKKNKKTLIVYNMTSYMDLIITNEDR